MRMKLAVSRERYDEVKAELERRGIIIDDQAPLVLCEASRFADSLIVKDPQQNSRRVLPVEEIVLIETYGHTVEVHTQTAAYQASERLYQIAAQLDPADFLRISHSVMIAKRHVRQISPTLSMKFRLTMSNGRIVDVTRSYYYIFKEAFGI